MKMRICEDARPLFRLARRLQCCRQHNAVCALYAVRRCEESALCSLATEQRVPQRRDRKFWFKGLLNLPVPVQFALVADKMVIKRFHI